MGASTEVKVRGGDGGPVVGAVEGKGKEEGIGVGMKDGYLERK